MMELPAGWEWLRLSEIVSRTENVDPSNHPDEKFELYSVPSHANNSPELQFGREIRSTKQVVKPGDVLLCKIIPHLVRVWVVPPRSTYRQIASGEWIVYRDHCCDAEYLYYALRAPSFREEFMQTISGVGGSLTRAKPEAVAKISVPLSPSGEQRRIVKKLNQLLAGMKRARKELKNIPILVSQYKRTILAAAFSSDLTREWRDERGLAVPSVETVEKLVSDIRYGTAQKCTPKPHGIAVLRIPNVASGRIDLTDLKYTDLSEKDLERLKIVAGDILVVRSNGSVDLLGRPALVSEREAGLAFAGYLIRLRPNTSRVLPEYLSLMLQAPQTRAIIEGGARSTVGVNNINSAELSALSVPAPTLSEQQEVVDRLNDAFRWLDAVAIEHAHAAQLLPKLEQAILAKAFRGELVPQDPYEEPASVLLERIRAKRGAGKENPRIRKVRSPNRPRAPKEKAAMTKSRFDPDVKDQPYLAKLIKKEGGRTGVDALFGRADLPIADFYKQLAWEVSAGYVRDADELLEAV